MGERIPRGATFNDHGNNGRDCGSTDWGQNTSISGANERAEGVVVF